MHLPLDTTQPPVQSRVEHVWGSEIVYDINASQEQISALGYEVHKRCPTANMMLLSGCKYLIWLTDVLGTLKQNAKANK